MNNLPKFVVSTTLKELAWHNSTLIKANIPEEVYQPGKRLFDEEMDKTVLRLADSTTFPSGIVVLSYRPAGKD